MGGEKSPASVPRVYGPGSPPHGRGKGRRIVPNVEGLRITPAWAGKSIRASRCSFGIEDHPRVGGEKLAMILVAYTMLGSPPRGRGKAAEPRPSLGPEGITPAWAGKSFATTASCQFWEDHPRVGGEKRQARTYTASCQGSPPRGRGKALDHNDQSAGQGITPAWAGKSAGQWFDVPGEQDHPRVGGEKRSTTMTKVLDRGSPPRGRGKVPTWLFMVL